jgi:hypothetical protein
VITVAACLWDANRHSRHFSRCYDESWAEKLYRNVAQHLTVPFRFKLYTDKTRKLNEPIEQVRLEMKDTHYGACIEPFKADEPTLFMGLDTIVVGNIDHLAKYAMSARKPAVPRDPFADTGPWKLTNAVVIAPAGCRSMLWDGYDNQNDMDWINTRDVAIMDELWPREVVSYKGRIQRTGLEDETRIVFFHGPHKPWELGQVGWIARAWHDNVKREAAA